MINAIDKYFFTCLLIVKGEKNAIKKVVLSMYNNNIQIRREKDLSIFYKIDPPLIWFLNTIGCHKCLVLVCFVDDTAFGSHAPDISCCNNCFYNLYESVNAGEDSSVPNWELYDVIIRHFLHYLKTNKWYRHQEHIAIAKIINIRIARFELKESEKIYGHSNTS